MSIQMGGSGWSQADTRRSGGMRDQHKRPWHAVFEKKSNAPVGVIHAEFSAPWIPDQKYLVLDPDRPHRLTINYDLALDDALKAHADYYQSAVECATSHKWETPVKGEPFRNEIQQIVGKPPTAWEPILAAKQGNSWILGFSKTPDPRLAHLVKQPRSAVKAASMAGLPDFSDLSAELAEDALNDLAEFDDDFSDEELEEVDAQLKGEDPREQTLAELEEQYDKDALGGHTVPVRASAAPKHPKARGAGKQRKGVTA